MIILEPISTAQTITILPREPLSGLSSFTVDLREDGTGIEYSYSGLSFSSNGEYTDISLPAITTFKEGTMYFLEIFGTSNSEVELIYRDKIYITSQLDFEKKHTVTSNRYVSYDTDDNRYII
jgi:hypothetical protein